MEDIVMAATPADERAEEQRLASEREYNAMVKGNGGKEE
jgi:hypothetical protein